MVKFLMFPSPTRYMLDIFNFLIPHYLHSWTMLMCKWYCMTLHTSHFLFRLICINIWMCMSGLDMNMHVCIWMSSCNLVNWRNACPFVTVQGVDLDMVPPMKDSSIPCHTLPIVRTTTTCDYQFCICLVVSCMLDWLALPRWHPFNPVTQR